MRDIDATVAELRRLLPELRRKYGVSQLWLFGSQARGDASDQSDLDVLVEFAHRRFSLIEFVGLELEMGDRLGVKVDLVDRSALRPEIAPSALRDAIAV